MCSTFSCSKNTSLLPSNVYSYILGCYDGNVCSSSCYDGNVGELTIGSLVEYHMACRGGSRMSAENVKLVPKSKGYIVSSL